MMEQYLLRVPKRVGEELRKKMAEKEVRGVDVVAGADNRNFKFRIDDTELPATLCQLPCIVETHKTYDEKLFYKSGDIGQILLVHDTPEEQMLYETVTELPGGITPPTTNIVKRKYAKTRKSPIFPKADVARVEDTLVKIIAGGIIEDVQEELVDFYDWMVDDEHPNGIVVHDEMDFIQRHPEYLDLTQSGSGGGGGMAPSLAFGSSNGVNSQANSRPESDIDDETPSRTPAISEDEDAPPSSKKLSPTKTLTKVTAAASTARDGLDDDLDDMMNDDMDDDDDDDAADGSSLQSNPEYLTLLNTRAQQTKKVSDLRKDISKMAANITSMANPVMKQRLLAQKESLERELADVQAAFEATADDIRRMESRN
ncbi:hypothetical protein H257_09491 [Aphanomyces astaci]|uniref:TAFII55 protein conserved region domain-containing protein n=2 Tax=Aphanomyces astaci TaxID=112090 RepID=W4GBL9_APHAT|nr:hypothetical protein H257_09491 [Aphanomyces astaci]ETV76474.1 hypothetical protein H257_09491 [Aphanomyces astaci]|eukprot:XP_009834019.1 hypothetical protein H257_09491 [Aphanomyces astaci]